MLIDRRRVICLSTGLFASGLAVPGTTAPPDPGTRARLSIDPSHEIAHIPASYGGFSVELATLADPDVFHAGNHEMIALYRRLSTQGVLRIGGNSSELCWWQARSGSRPPQIHPAGIGRADNWMPQRLTPITPAAIDHLRGFLEATGWSCIYGLPFGTGTPAADAEHAAYVAHALGPRLRYFQIGNEPDFYQDANNRLRPQGWGFEDYAREWQAIAEAVSATVPAARFGGPDVGSSGDWVVRFAERMKPLMGERLIELTGHYYALGPPDSPQASIGHLLTRDPRITERMALIMSAANQQGLSFRMSEGNSCFRGGKAGLSNALAAAIWGMDYMLYMATLGCTGINFHGGGGNVISSALGDKLPGARDARDLEIAKLGTFYSPIAGNRQAGYTARPLFYAMMAVQAFAGCALFPATLDGGTFDATAYAGHGPGGWRIAIVNKDLQRDLILELPALPFGECAIWRLTGPAIDATTDISLAGATIRGAGSQWQPSPPETGVECRRGTVLGVPRASACILLERPLQSV
jgi:hypothetical protein